MTETEYDKLWHDLLKEIDEFRDSFNQKTPKEVYEEYYKIHAYEDLYDYLCYDAINLDYKGFPKKNILQDFYNQFMKSNYELNFEDLTDFFKFQIEENIKCKRFDNEM